MTSNEQILHALDLAAVQDWDEAKRLLEVLEDSVAARVFLLVTELEQREVAQARRMGTIRHEIGNALAIVQANLEGLADGVLAATPERLRGLLASIEEAGRKLENLRKIPEEGYQRAVVLETLDVRVFIGAQVAAMTSLAAAKNVRLAFDDDADSAESWEYRADGGPLGEIIRIALMRAIRNAPPGGEIAVYCAREHANVRLIIEIADREGSTSQELPVFPLPEKR